MKFKTHEMDFEGTLTEFKELMRTLGMKTSETTPESNVERIQITRSENEFVDIASFGCPYIESKITGTNYEFIVVFKNGGSMESSMYIPQETKEQLFKDKKTITDYLKGLFA